MIKKFSFGQKTPEPVKKKRKEYAPRQTKELAVPETDKRVEIIILEDGRAIDLIKTGGTIPKPEPKEEDDL